jgi:hypothetical protein
MSQHQDPYSFGYSPFPAQPQPIASFTYNSTSAQSQTTHTAPVPTASDQHAVNAASYDLNASRIPGLAFGARTASATSQHIGNSQSWHQFPSSNLPLAVSLQQQSSTSPTVPKPPAGPHVPPNQVPKPQPPIPSPDVVELSEGEFDEFEDLYEPGITGSVRGDPSPRPPQQAETGHESTGDADGSSIYDETRSPQAEPIVESTSTSLPAVEDEYSPDEDWEPTAPQRDRSGSYSPFLSPSEVQRKASAAQPTSTESKRRAVSRHHSQPLSVPGITFSQQAAPAAKASSNSQAKHGHTEDNKQGTIASGGSNNPAEATSNLPLLSAAQVKKKAQEAILGLWPMKIRFQTYVDEGFDEKLIRSLFIELGLDMKSSATYQKSPASPHLSPGMGATSSLLTKAGEPQQPPSQSSAASQAKKATSRDTAGSENPIGVKPTAKSAAEERKDKIARKLAAKTQKPAAPVTVPELKSSSVPVTNKVPVTDAKPTAPAPPSKPLTPSVPPAKAKTRAENNALLHQKLAALKKKEQEKAAAEKAPAANGGMASPVVNDEPSQHSPALSNGGDAQSIQNNSKSVQPSPLVQDGPIPGLSFSPVQTMQAKKRPVAADFDNYVTNAAPIKRTRTQETLIIDVSDDEDVEMDIGSPTDMPELSIEDPTPPSRQTPLAAFPPLSDPHNRNRRSSPTTTSHTPQKGTKLNMLHGRIEEMKRLIAEAEAKRPTKKANGTPDLTGQSSPASVSSPAPDSLRLPKVRERRHNPRHASIVRRDRIVSHELPQIEASLREKQDRWKQLISQTAELETEIRKSMAEKDQLTSEMTQLGQAIEEPSTDSRSKSPSAELSRTPLIDNELHAPVQRPSSSALDSPMVFPDAEEGNAGGGNSTQSVVVGLGLHHSAENAAADVEDVDMALESSEEPIQGENSPAKDLGTTKQSSEALSQSGSEANSHSPSRTTDVASSGQATTQRHEGSSTVRTPSHETSHSDNPLSETAFIEVGNDQVSEVTTGPEIAPSSEERDIAVIEQQVASEVLDGLQPIGVTNPGLEPASGEVVISYVLGASLTNSESRLMRRHHRLSRT